jgi:hypothetical protein
MHSYLFPRAFELIHNVMAQLEPAEYPSDFNELELTDGVSSLILLGPFGMRQRRRQR